MLILRKHGLRSPSTTTRFGPVLFPNIREHATNIVLSVLLIIALGPGE